MTRPAIAALVIIRECDQREAVGRIPHTASFHPASSRRSHSHTRLIMYHWKLQKRIESLQQQNRVLKCELETYKLRVKSLQEENKAIRQASVHIVSFVALQL